MPAGPPLYGYSLIPSGGDDDGLTNLLLQASFDGRLKSDEGTLSAAGDLATLTAGTGKDLYLTAAKVIFYSNDTSSAGSIADEVVLRVNGAIVETAKYTWNAPSASGSPGSFTFDYEFKNIGHKVVATQILKIEVITLDADTDVEGFIQAVEVPTGENPVTYTGS